MAANIIIKFSICGPSHEQKVWVSSDDLIKKDDYKAVISTLEDKGLRWAENEKKALRRHLKTIVTNAQ